ncbi:cyclase/dehydrase [Thioalkalivibrio sp.]|uniref:cyclase/dehydrase n=1 Tax=Thioalkalivibrio sp. TaxID=2093813 RepID=UPI003974AB2B
MPGRGWSLLGVAMGCLLFPSWALADPDIHVTYDGARLEFRLDASVQASLAAVQAVVHDYDRLDRILPLVVESRFLGPAGDGVARVFTLMRGCLLFVCREGPHTIDVRRVPGGWSSGISVPELSRVRRGQFSWRIDQETGDSPGVQIQMYGYFEPDFAVPPVLGPPLVRLWVRSELRASIDRIEQAAIAHQDRQTMREAP